MTHYTDYVRETFSHLGPIDTKRMFGGYGVYCDGVMFALIEKDCLYLKADGHCSYYFEQEGLKQFEYSKSGKKIKMSYFQAPAEVFEDQEIAATWADRSLEAARRAQLAK